MSYIVAHFYMSTAIFVVMPVVNPVDSLIESTIALWIVAAFCSETALAKITGHNLGYTRRLLAGFPLQKLTNAPAGFVGGG